MRKAATYSTDATLRWTLSRDWNDSGWRVLFLGHNPSTAGHEVEDPTTRAWLHYAKLWGACGYTAVNLYPLRSPNPADVYAWLPGQFDAMAENVQNIMRETQRCTTVVACYGAIARDEKWADYILRKIGGKVYVFGLTAAGIPKHPMARGKSRVPSGQQPIMWREHANV